MSYDPKTSTIKLGGTPTEFLTDLQRHMRHVSIRAAEDSVATSLSDHDLQLRWQIVRTWLGSTSERLTAAEQAKLAQLIDLMVSDRKEAAQPSGVPSEVVLAIRNITPFKEEIAEAATGALGATQREPKKRQSAHRLKIWIYLSFVYSLAVVTILVVFPEETGRIIDTFTFRGRAETTIDWPKLAIVCGIPWVGGIVYLGYRSIRR